MIVVTGATGELGRAVVETLLRYVPAAQVALSVRKPEDAQAFAARGVAVRRGDFDEPESLARSFVGADRLLIVSASGIDHESRAVRHRNAINAAMRAGVGHVYYTSLLPGQDSVAYVMKAHLDTEAYLMASGLPFTILKNGVYAESWPLYLGDVTGDEEVIPADGPVSWVSRGPRGGNGQASLRRGTPGRDAELDRSGCARNQGRGGDPGPRSGPTARPENRSVGRVRRPPDVHREVGRLCPPMGNHLPGNGPGRVREGRSIARNTARPTASHDCGSAGTRSKRRRLKTDRCHPRPEIRGRTGLRDGRHGSASLPTFRRKIYESASTRPRRNTLLLVCQKTISRSAELGNTSSTICTCSLTPYGIGP